MSRSWVVNFELRRGRRTIHATGTIYRQYRTDLKTVLVGEPDYREGLCELLNYVV
jgi:monomeric isocitrate dehydrogenase